MYISNLTIQICIYFVVLLLSTLPLNTIIVFVNFRSKETSLRFCNPLTIGSFGDFYFNTCSELFMSFVV